MYHSALNIHFPDAKQENFLPCPLMITIGVSERGEDAAKCLRYMVCITR